MTERRIRNIVIVGGGSAGWMAASAFAKVLGARYAIRLIESEEIGIVGVGESTVPHLKLFNKVLEIDEIEFVKQTQATFKLGIQFVDWLRLGHRYVHGFGVIGHDHGILPFHQYWLKAHRLGRAGDLGDYSLNTLAAERGRFMPSPTNVTESSPLANIAYSYQFDAGLYAAWLRRYAEERGVQRSEGKIARTLLRADDGFVESVVMENGEVIAGDLFIDCSGFRGLLIEQALHTGYEDWSHWLPCNRAVVVPCASVEAPTPYTRVTARPAGWQWRIPLQHRVGNGYVYSSNHVSDDEAAATLLANIDGRALADARVLRFTSGRRKKFWNRNVIALGLASGFIEPLESTSIFLVQSGISRLLGLFPEPDFSPTLIDRFNEQTVFEWERIRDFLILHYNATERSDTPFWDYCRTMEIPPSLRGYLELFRDSGRFFRNADEMFAITSWVEVMIGQGVLPQRYHPVVDQLNDAELDALVGGVKRVVANCVDAMPMHQEFIDRYCKAPSA
ncbi:MAG: tryptophan halogenase family protein [Rudaea sp.]